MTATASKKGISNMRNLVAACAAITVFGFTFGLGYPLLSLILESQGHSENMIGVNGAMLPIGILLAAPVIPAAVKKFGSRETAIFSAFMISITFLGYKIFPSLEAWFVLRLIQGMFASTLFVLSEAWIVKFAGSSHRGRIVAIYGVVMSISFGAGPVAISIIGIEGWAPFILGAVVLMLGIIPLLFVRDSNDDNPDEETGSFFTFAPKAPMLLIAVAVYAIYDAATLSLMAVYGIRLGLDQVTATNVITALVFGNVIFQYPIGWLADIFPKRAVMAGCAFVTLIALFLLPPAMNTFWMWPVLLVAGATGYGIYSVALAALGDRFQGLELVTGMAAFSIVWGGGALVGSIIGGWFMTGFGPHGLPVGLGIIFTLYLIGYAMRSRSLAKKSA